MRKRTFIDQEHKIQFVMTDNSIELWDKNDADWWQLIGVSETYKAESSVFEKIILNLGFTEY